MAFSQMMEVLKEKDKGNIVFVKLGAFYVAVAEDAVLVHKLIGLKCTCFKKNICKVGFPINAYEKYVEELNKTKYGYVIYDYDANKAELKEKLRKRGKYNKEKEKSINCLLCKEHIKDKYEDDKYMLAVTRVLLEEQKKKEVDIEEIY